MSNSAIWILGAQDPEMALIEGLLAGRGRAVAHALSPSGARVRPDEAYYGAAPGAPVASGDRVVLVECDPVLPVGAHVVRVDHHRPGDPGYGWPAIDFLAASSLGQVWLRLGEMGALGWRASAPEALCASLLMDGSDWILHAVAKRGVLFRDQRDLDAQARGDAPARQTVKLPLPREHVLAAAADHCLAAAYRAECPGVDPDELMRWRVETRAAHQGRAVSDVLADIERARQALRAAPRRYIDGIPVADLTAIGTVPELPEAAAREGVPFLARLQERGRTKLVLQAAPARAVIDWMEQQRALGRAPYGDPARGFAGVVISN